MNLHSYEMIPLNVSFIIDQSYEVLKIEDSLCGHILRARLSTFLLKHMSDQEEQGVLDIKH